MADKIKYGAGGVPYVSKKQSNVLSEILTENPNVIDVSVEIDDDTVDEDPMNDKEDDDKEDDFNKRLKKLARIFNSSLCLGFKGKQNKKNLTGKEAKPLM